jgi:hypothetical protein
VNEVAGRRLYSVQVKIAVALIYASAALPFHIAYGTLTSALIASTISLAAAGLLVYLCPPRRCGNTECPWSSWVSLLRT